MTSPLSPLVSVVTPFYNTRDFLAECIESVLAQSYEHFEYVLVDNQSADGSSAIAADYASKDSRIRLVRTPEFFSQQRNYNRALEQISPESRYCKMVQADDWIFPECLSQMVAVAEAHPSVAIVGSFQLEGRNVRCTGLPPDQKVISGKTACRLFLLENTFLFGSPTTVLYRSDIVRARKPFFAETRPHEDTEAVFDILADHDFGFVHQVLSFSRVDEQSIMGQLTTFNPELLDRYIIIKDHGRRYLTPSEYESCLDDIMLKLYRTLGWRWVVDRVSGRDERFWDYYKRTLGLLGERLDPVALARNVAIVLLKEALSPIKMLRLAKTTVAAQKK